MCSSGVLRLYVSSSVLLSVEVDCEDKLLLNDVLMLTRDEVDDLPPLHTTVFVKPDDIVWPIHLYGYVAEFGPTDNCLHRCRVARSCWTAA